MKSLLLFLVLFFCQNISAQTEDANACPAYFTTENLHGNNLKTAIVNNGNLFFDGSNGNFEMPYEPDGIGIDAFFANGLWIGGYEEGTDNLKMAAAQYGSSAGSVDYFVGPIEFDGEPSNCELWNKIWSVRRQEIEAHLQDFGVDGIIDIPIANILGWPGNGNPQFVDIHGFELPDTPDGLAPFLDVNGNGIYEPMEGEVPTLENINLVPEQLLWCIYNDYGNGNIHGETQGDPLLIEVHLTAWAYSCDGDHPINNSIFTSHKIFNRSDITLDSVYAGMWIDPDLGCNCDDGIGSSEDLNTVFTYNLAEDNCCSSGGFTEGQPVVSATLLNRGLEHSVVFQNLSVGSPPCTNEPVQADNFYRILTSGDLTFGEFGCNPANPPTNISFPDDPNDPTGWSMMNVNATGLDSRVVMSTGLDKLEPGESATLDMSYGFHRGEGLSHLENVTLMYDEVEQLHESYSNQFQTACIQPTCSDDCVWPGDTNRDNIVNHCDLLPIGLAFEDDGTPRQPPNFWAPWDSEPWANGINGVNFKHTDCDGNGATNEDDIALIYDHYQLTTPGFVPTPDEYPVGPELILDPSAFVPENAMLGEFMSIRCRLIEDVPELYGIALQVEYDGRYFPNLNFDAVAEEDLVYASELKIDGNTVTGDYSLVRTDASAVISPQALFNLFGYTLSFIVPDLPSNQTTVKLKNIKGIRADGSEIELGATSLLITFPEITVSDVGETGLPEIHVFPNPSNGIFQVNLPDGQIDELWVTDVFGKTVKSEKVTSERFELDLGTQADGLYFLNIKSDNDLIMRKLVLSK